MSVGPATATSRPPKVTHGPSEELCRLMTLAFDPPVAPMLARLTDELPHGNRWAFEPKWDGFRALVFRDGDRIFIQSREGRPLARYFPELIEPFLRDLPPTCVLDGELVIMGPNGLDFDALQLRLHPAASRVAKLSREQPAAFVAFDLLALGTVDLRDRPQRERRAALERELVDIRPPNYLTPQTRKPGLARRWFDEFEGAGLDGVIAKGIDDPYLSGVRAMIKVKHVRTADCVVGGFRWHKHGKGTQIASLLLGLYDPDGLLHHVGIASSFTTELRKSLVDELAPLRVDASRGHPWLEAPDRNDTVHRRPGSDSRWSSGKDLSWEPLRIERACEVKYDHVQGMRFRHATRFVRWRFDKSPMACRFDQLEVTAPYELLRIFGQPDPRDQSFDERHLPSS